LYALLHSMFVYYFIIEESGQYYEILVKPISKMSFEMGFG